MNQGAAACSPFGFGACDPAILADMHRRGLEPTPEAPTGGTRLAPMLLQRSALVVFLVVIVAALLGVVRMRQDIAEEVEGAQSLTAMLDELARLEQLDDDQARQRLVALQSSQRLRHVEFSVRDHTGRELLGVRPGAMTGEARSVPEPLNPRGDAAAQWTLPRPDGQRWQVSMWVSEQAERTEALRNLLASLALLIVGALILLAVIRWNLQRVFRPLGSLLVAIEGVERENHGPLRRLASMPVQELERVAAALRHLATSLEEAQARRRMLSQKMLTLQEEERAHLARELHDELGQRLTSMRVDAAWLSRKVPLDDPRREVVLNLERQCEDLQVDVRQLLVRLRPMAVGQTGVGSSGASDAQGVDEEPLARLREWLEPLVQGWANRPSSELAVRLELDLGDPQALWPRSVLLALYRLSQEALTNVNRHAQAGSARLCVTVEAGNVLVWQVEDDGVGLGDTSLAMQRGNGLAGMQERVQALGGEFQLSPVRPAERPGLCIRARFDRQVHRTSVGA